MSRSLIRITQLLVAALPLVTSAADAGLMIHDPYVRLAPPSAPTSAAFLVIKNAGGADRTLIKAESAIAKTVELHTHINDNGVMKMRQVPSIDIKANGQAELKPGGYHIMLIGLKKTLREGDVVAITLSFDDGSQKLVAAPVRSLQTTMPTGMSHGAMKP